MTARKGFWNKVLGVGDFYFEVGVRAVEVCLAFRERDGGVPLPSFFSIPLFPF